MSQFSFSEVINVGTFSAPPYISINGQEPNGLTVRYWLEIAQRIQLETKFHIYKDLDDALNGLKTNEVSLLIGAIPIVPRIADQFAFTQPFHHIQLGSLVLQKTVSSWNRIVNALGDDFVIVFVSMFIAFIIFSVLIWYIERKANKEQFFEDARSGIREGMWFAASTMTTGGYAEKAPVTTMGRVITCVWMVASVLLFSSITASMTTLFTMSTMSVTNSVPQGLLNHKIVAVYDQVTADIVKNNFGARAQIYSDLESLLPDLQTGKISAIIADYEELMHLIKTKENSGVVVLNIGVKGESYGFLFPRYESKYYKQVNDEIIWTYAVSNSVLK